MNLSRVKVWTAEILYASDLNAEFDNILTHEIANADCAATMALEGSKLKNADIDLTTKPKGILPVANGGTGVADDTYDADKVDGIHAAVSATANRLLALDGSSKFPLTVLKTAQGSVSYTGPGNGAPPGNLTLPGGEYGFYPRIKVSTGTIAFYLGNTFGGTSYTTNVGIVASQGRTGYVQQRYLTASGRDHWIFLLYDKVEKEIVAGYEAPDHPSYGQSGDENEIPHPFASYWSIPLPVNLEIILVDNAIVNELKKKTTKKREILEVINDEYVPDLSKEIAYKPRDIADETGRHREVKKIPDYIKVRKLKVKK